MEVQAESSRFTSLAAAYYAEIGVLLFAPGIRLPLSYKQPYQLVSLKPNTQNIDNH